MRIHYMHMTVIHKLHICMEKMLRTEFNMWGKQVLVPTEKSLFFADKWTWIVSGICWLLKHNDFKKWCAGLNNSGPTGKLPLSIKWTFLQNREHQHPISSWHIFKFESWWKIRKKFNAEVKLHQGLLPTAWPLNVPYYGSWAI